MYKSVAPQFGRFLLVRELGRRLNSTTYLAQDPEIQRLVVIKAFAKGAVVPKELSLRMLSVSKLSHAGIAKIFDLEYTEAVEAPYIVAEFVEGESLEALLAKRKLGQREALALTLELLDALSYAHAHGVYHHNLNPSNLIITPDCRLKVTDFKATTSGVTAFIAPEQLKGGGDGRSDLFSVGVILYLMLSGYRPFQGNTEATIGFRLIHQHPVPVAAMNLDLSPELDCVIGRFLAKDPAERYSTADEAMLDIVKIKDAQGAGLTRSRLIESSELSPALIDAIGYRASGAVNLEGIVRRPKSETKATSYRMWSLATPSAVAIIGIAMFTITRPLREPIPAPPILVAHLNVPSFAMEKQRPQFKARTVLAHLARATPPGRQRLHRRKLTSLLFRSSCASLSRNVSCQSGWTSG